MNIWFFVLLLPVALLFGYFVIGELILGHWFGRLHLGRRHKETSK